MRKILLLSSVFALSFGVFAEHNEANAWSSAAIVAAINSLKANNKKEIDEQEANQINKQQEVLENGTTADQKNAEQRDSTVVAAQTQATRTADALSSNQTIQTQQAAMYNDYSRVSGVGDYACSFITADGTTGNAYTQKSRKQDEIEEENKNNLAGATGSPIGDGIVNGRVNLYKPDMCKDIESGTRECTGTDNDYLSAGTALNNKNMTADQDAKMEYYTTVAYMPTLPAVQPDLYQNPNTNMKNIAVESDRIRMLMSISPSVMASIRASRKPTDGGGAITKIRETLLHGGFLPQDEVDKLVPESGVSMMALFEAAGLALRNPNYMKEKYVADPALIPLTTAYIGGVQTTQLNRIIELLEYVALGTASNVTLNAEELMDKNAVKRGAANSSTMASIR